MTVSVTRTQVMPNTAKVQAIIWWIISVAIIAGIFMPFILGIDLEQWGFGISLVCLVAGIVGIIVAVVYTRRARLINRLLNEQNLLAHWKYDPLEWRSYAQEDHEVNKKEKRKLFLLILSIAIIVGVILIVSRPDGTLIFLYTILGLILVIGCAAFLSVWIRYQQNRKHLGEVYISPEGVYINRELHIWHGMGAALEEVVLQASRRSQVILAITYSVPNRYNRQQVTVRVPVPQGEEEAAGKVAENLLSEIKQKQHRRE
jgi:hypothetical protein